MRLIRRLWGLLRGRRYEADLDDELAFHLDMEAEENRRRGMPEAQARQKAQAALGGVAHTKELHRSATGLPWLEDAFRDARLALRSMRRAPGFAASIILLIGLGIGATAAVFTVVDGILLRPLPYRQPGELVQLLRVGQTDSGEGQDGATVQALRPLGDLAAVGWLSGKNLLAGQTAMHIQAQPVSHELFSVLGVAPREGRAFAATDEVTGAPPVVIMTDGLASKLGVEIGATIRLGTREAQVVGVMPRGFRPLARADVLVPFQIGPEGNGTNYAVIGRARDGRARADRILAGAAAELHQTHTLGPETQLRWRGLQDQLAEWRRPSVLLLFGAVGLVLLVACANVAGLLLVKAQARGPELAVRAALGGGRGRLVRQLLVESLVFALAGGLVGVGLAWLGVDSLLALAPHDLAEWGLGIDGRVLGFSLILTVVTGVGFGLAPALRASRVDLRSAASGLHAVAPRARWRRVLLIGELAMCTLLLLGAGLLGRTLVALGAVQIGYATGETVAMTMSADADDPATIQAFDERALREAQGLPGLRKVILASGTPGRRGLNLPMHVPGKSRPEAVGWRYASPGYFELLQIPILRGRALGEEDRAGAAPVAVVNEDFVRAYYPDGDVIGQPFILEKFVADAGDTPRTIVGVVGNTLDDSVTEAAGPEVYVPLAQVPPGLFSLTHRFFDACWLVDTSLPPAQAAAHLADGFRAIRPGLPFADVARLADVASDRLSSERFLATLLAVFAGMAMVIGATGIYGVAAYSVTRRSREIGIRLALGALPARIVRGILGEALRDAAIGVAIGFAVGLILRPLLERFIFGVGAFDPVSAAGAATLLLAVALFACLAPALRAARIDPAANLRS